MPDSTGVATRRRADARRNREAIVDAAMECLGRDPETSAGEIARVAGVGRVTLYSHFSTRAELVDAAFTRAIDQGEAALAALDLEGDPMAALSRLVDSSWELVERSRSLLAAAQKAPLPPGRIRSLHARPMERVSRIVRRGQDEGRFRSDLPVSWLVGVIHSVMHGAAEEVNEGRVDSRDAAGFITATLTAALGANADSPTRAGR